MNKTKKIQSSIHSLLFSLPQWQCALKPNILLEVVAAVPVMLILLREPTSDLHCLSFLVEHLLHVLCQPLHQPQPVQLLNPHHPFILLVFLEEGQMDSVRSQPTTHAIANLAQEIASIPFCIWNIQRFAELLNNTTTHLQFRDNKLAWSASLVGGREICMTRRDEEEMQTPYRKAPGVRNWIGNLSAVRCRPEHRCVLQQRINNNYYNYWQHDRVHHLFWGGIALQHVLFL